MRSHAAHGNEEPQGSQLSAQGMLMGTGEMLHRPLDLNGQIHHGLEYGEMFVFCHFSCFACATSPAPCITTKSSRMCSHAAQPKGTFFGAPVGGMGTSKPKNSNSSKKQRAKGPNFPIVRSEHNERKGYRSYRPNRQRHRGNGQSTRCLGYSHWHSPTSNSATDTQKQD